MEEDNLRHEKVQSEDRVFEIACRPIVECEECGTQNPPEHDACANCGSSELYEQGLAFRDDIGTAWAQIQEELGETPAQEDAFEFVMTSLQAHAELYQALYDSGWDLAEVSETGELVFVKMD